MGIDAGFDMVPRLTKSADDRWKWKAFIEFVMEEFEDDDRVDFKDKYIEFKVGEHPRLPLEGHKFLRFSSKISGREGHLAEEYINNVARIASGFGSRRRYWTELRDQYGYYGWKEVDESLSSYEQDKSTKIGSGNALDVAVAQVTQNIERPCYTIEPIPDKGKGLVARVNIPAGTRIIAEKPLFSAMSSVGALDSIIIAKVKALSKDQQRQYLCLHNKHKGGNPFSGIFKTNALPCGPDSPIGAVYPTICLINHSCLSNSHNSWNSATDTETIHAIRDIKAGEEITISYAAGEVSIERLIKLKSAFGFKCDCELCSRTPYQSQESDARRVEIQSLDQAIGDPSRTLNSPNRGIADCQRMLRLLRDEYGSCPPLETRLYYDAFQISVIHSDQARASAFAERAFRARLIGEGEDSPETAKMKSLMAKPMSHQSYGVSKRWRTAKSSAPKGLNEEKFEEWLWRRGEK